jgi:amino acid adenylation domain-containing protein
MVAGLLGILKAGAAYVPLDPAYAADRLAWMLADCAPVAVLAQAALEPRVQDLLSAGAHSHPPVLLLDDAGGAADDPQVPGLTPEHLAYVIYTSGSTGMPKGVANAHAGVVNRLLWARDEYRIGSGERLLQKTPFSFDVSVWEFFLPLLAGAQLVIARPYGHQDPRYLAQLIADAGITTIHFVPSMLQVFLDSGPAPHCASLRRVLCSGEALPHALQMRLHAALPGVELHNLYGPTEAAVDVTAWHCRPDRRPGAVPIGRPIANVRIYLLDRHLQPVPLGVAGEIHIGGVAVARGYLNRPELSAERFIPDPFSGAPGARLYKTGDLGRWRADGAIEYLGRNDFQVKLRGLRIELGEIEAALAACDGVREAVVLARDDGGERRLVAYLVAAAGAAPGIADLRGQLARSLPDYMVPAAFVTLAAFPLTASGKVDRRALPAPGQSAVLARAYEPPQGAAEEALAALWRELLGLEQVGRHDQFFELGGHSLQVVAMLERLRQQGLRADVRTVFTHPTLADLAAAMSAPAGAAPAFVAPPNLIPGPAGSIISDIDDEEFEL